jgi:hypothetical protein
VGYDAGGLLQPGLTLAWNGTGSPERVTPASGGGGEVHIHFHGPVVGPGGMDAVAEQVRLSLLRRKRSLTSVGLS